MKVLFWYCDQFHWKPGQKTLDDAPEPSSANNENCVAAFVHVETVDVDDNRYRETKLVKNAKWLARKWEVKKIILHSFTHLSEDKALPADAKAILDRVSLRLISSGYDCIQTPYGYFLDLIINAPGHPLARIFKSF